MRVAVARRYEFEAHHHVDGLPEPWCENHWHNYTVEVVAESAEIVEGDPPDVVVDTDVLDAVWDEQRRLIEGTDLNESTGTSTTVEALAVWFLRLFEQVTDYVVEVTVWEDGTRWGRARL